MSDTSKNLNNIATCLWFDGNAEEAAELYTSIFPNSKITTRNHYPNVGQEIHGREPGSLMIIEWELNGNKYVGLNGGPNFQFDEAVSIMVSCADQAEVDYYWAKLGQGGDESRKQCGWLADKFGLRWQIVPRQLLEMLQSTETDKRERAYMAMMGMKKLDVAELQRAFDGK